MLTNMEPLNPTPSLLCKLGSLAVHVEKMLSYNGHVFDRVAMVGLIEDEEVQRWLKEMDQLALVPRKRM